MSEALTGHSVDGPMLRIRDSPLARIADRRVVVAWNLAREAHRKQIRKVSGLPFFVHPITVAENLAAMNCPVELVIAALLHDTVEDASVSLAAMEALLAMK
jgi:(p)ppGpp synthase/HD superfamily hydrolase